MEGSGRPREIPGWGRGGAGRASPVTSPTPGALGDEQAGLCDAGGRCSVAKGSSQA